MKKVTRLALVFVGILLLVSCSAPGQSTSKSMAHGENLPPVHDTNAVYELVNDEGSLRMQVEVSDRDRGIQTVAVSGPEGEQELSDVVGHYRASVKQDGAKR